MTLKYFQRVSKSEQPHSKSLIDKPALDNKPLNQVLQGTETPNLKAFSSKDISCLTEQE